MMKYISAFIVAILLFSLCLTPVSADESEGWKEYFFLPADGLDLNLIYKYFNDVQPFSSEPNKTNWERIQEDLQPYNAKLNFDEAYIFYTGILDDYEYSLERLNYDSAPVDFRERCIMIPAYADNGLAVTIQISCNFPGRSGLPSREEDVTGTIDEVYEDFGSAINYYSLPEWAELQEIDYSGAKQAYETVKRTGASINKIMKSYYDKSDDYDGSYREYLYIVTVKEECKGYIYSCTKDKLYTFEEYMHAKRIDYNSTPESSFKSTSVPITPTLTSLPTATPRPSKTAAATSRPTVTVSAAAPSAEQTASPMLTAAMSILPSPSAESNSSAADAVFIVLGVILCCAAAGGIVWAAISARKKKAGK